MSLTEEIIKELVREDIIASIESRLDVIPQQDETLKQEIKNKMMSSVTERDFLDICRMKTNNLLKFMNQLEDQDLTIREMKTSLNLDKSNLERTLILH